MVFNYKQIHKNDIFALKLAGIFANENNNYSKFHRYYFVSINILFLSILNAVMTINWVLKTDSLKSCARLGYIILNFLMAQAKTILWYLNRAEYGTLLTDLNLDIFQPRGEAEIIISTNVYNKYGKIRTALLITCWVAIFGVITIPLLPQVEETLPVAAWYPIGIDYTPAYEIAYLHQAVCIIIIGFINVHTDVIVGGFLSFIGLQCDLLCYRLGELGNQGPMVTQDGWKECIQHHKLILGYVHRFLCLWYLETTERVFGMMYFGQIFASTTAYCMDLFLLSLLQPSFEFFVLLTYLIAVGILMFVPCWFGTEMTRKSENIHTAAYYSNWVDAPNSFKKDIIIFMAKSKEPLKFYAARYFEISVEIFLTIIRTSFSYFTVMQNLNVAE